MPYEIKLDHVPAGYASKGGREGDTVTVCFRDFFSSEDGQDLIHHLEGVPRDVIKKLPREAKASESTTDDLLVIIRKDQTATVYHNEFRPTVIARIKGNKNAGEEIYCDDLLDIERVELGSVHIPPEAGICYVFSLGWRKGLFFDYGPILQGHEKPRAYDLGRTLAQCHVQVLFQHLFSIDDVVWNEMLQQGWFPFVHLRQERIRSMIGFAREKLPMDDLLNPIRDDLLKSLAEKIPTWDKDKILAPHHDFINAAYRHYAGGDYLSASAILYPRIEGIMRTHTSHVSPNASFKQNSLVEVNATAGGAIIGKSLLLPERFREYLSKVYFAAFDPKNPQGVSRHTVSHGVVGATSLDCKAATVAFLILLQISSASAFSMKPGSK